MSYSDASVKMPLCLERTHLLNAHFPFRPRATPSFRSTLCSREPVFLVEELLSAWWDSWPAWSTESAASQETTTTQSKPRPPPTNLLPCDLQPGGDSGQQTVGWPLVWFPNPLAPDYMSVGEPDYWPPALGIRGVPLRVISCDFNFFLFITIMPSCYF